jgi:hypothetical protein
MVDRWFYHVERWIMSQATQQDKNSKESAISSAVACDVERDMIIKVRRWKGYLI